jgi:uncharacterized delta-60 repeat protein
MVPWPAAQGQVAGFFDSSLNTVVTGNSVLAIAEQPDGKFVIGGDIVTVAGQSRPFFARLLATGAVESTATFAMGSGANDTIYGVTIQKDGKVLLTGDFTGISGQARSRVARLNGDGTVESASTFNPGSGPNGFVHTALVQPDEKIILHGLFTTVNGQARNNVARLNADGTLESLPSFNIGTGATGGDTASLALQADGKILVGGTFTSFNSQPRNRIARLLADGSVESTATFNSGSGANNNPSNILVQPDGKLLLGGSFTMINGQPRNFIARLNADGTLESTTTFAAGSGPNDSVRGMALQADGKILIAGRFTSVNGQPRNRIARLHPNGTLESTTTFDAGTGFNADPAGIMLQADGKIQVVGSFTTVNGHSQGLIARLLNDPAPQALTVEPSGVVWHRGGSAPEVRDVSFEVSTNGGSSWSLIGTGNRFAGGWERSGLSMTGSGQIRARGRTDCGYHMASSGMVEIIAAFSFSSLDLWRHSHFGTAANSGLAANNADPDKDGLENLVEYAFGGDPNVPDASRLPAWEKDDNEYVLAFTRPANVSGVTYAAEYSTNLSPESWTPLVNLVASPAYVFAAPGAGPRLYLRVRVTMP